MTLSPKEKAKELIDKFSCIAGKESWHDFADDVQKKQYALIAVDEALNVFSQMHSKLVLMDIIHGTVEETATYNYWQEVKKELENDTKNNI